MHKMVKRVPAAVLVGLLSALLVGGMVGFAVAAGDDEGGVPTVFGVVEPRGGDQWDYDVEMSFRLQGSIQGEVINEGMTFYGSDRYKWGDARAWQDGAGQFHEARHLDEDFQIHFEDERPDGSRVSESVESQYSFVMPTDGSPAIGRYETGTWSFKLPQESVGLPFISQDEGVEYDASWEETVYTDLSQPFCGYRSDLQGGNIVLADGVRFHGSCTLDELDEVIPITLDDIYYPHSVEEIEGMQAVRFSQGFEIGQVDLWMARHVPYPVQTLLTIDVDLREIEPSIPPGIRMTMEIRATMTGFESGEEAFAQDLSLPDPVVLAPIHAGPRHVYGPSDDGVQVAFPLSEAYERARLAEDYEDLADFLEDHPGAVVTYAKASLHTTENRHEDRWLFQVDGSDEFIQVRATRTMETDDEIPVIAENAPAFSFYTADEGELEDPVVALPDELPTVRTAIDRWQNYFPGEAANVYGFDLRCEYCPGPHVWVGHEQAESTSPGLAATVTGGEWGYDGQRHIVGVGLDGNTLFQREESSSYSQRQSGLLPVEDQSPSQTAPADPEPVPTTTAGVWRLDSPAAATGVGVTALLTGLLYYLWPLVKAGPAALFSRVHGEQLLDHPVRASLMQTVEERPGIHYQELVRTLGKGRGVVEHHMRKLQQSGFVVSHATDGITCFFPKGQVDRRIMAAVPAIKNTTAQKILQGVLAQPGTSQRDLASILGISPSTVNHHLSKLVEAGLVEKQRDGPTISLSPTGLASQSLAVIAA